MIGKVMKCVFKMVVLREREIKNFVKKKYYKIAENFNTKMELFSVESKVNENSTKFETPIYTIKQNLIKEKK